jgi:hypothetical protein
MIIPGDQGPIHEEEGLFRIKDLKSGPAFNKVAEDVDSNIVAESDEDDEDGKPKNPKTEKFSREKGKLDKSGLFYKSSDSEGENSDDESSEDDYLLEEDDTEEKGPISSTGHVNDDEYMKHPLLVDLEDGATRKERRAQVFIGFFNINLAFSSLNSGSASALRSGLIRTSLKGSRTTKISKMLTFRQP